MERPKNILVMCRVNVGRSPFFAAALATMLEGSGINVFSRGTSAPDRLEPYKSTGETSIPTRQMVAKMAEKEGFQNLSSTQLGKIHRFLTQHHSTVVTLNDILKADLILTMEPKLNEQISKLFPNYSGLKTKLFAAPEFYTQKILGLSKLSTKGRMIKDPIYLDVTGIVSEVPVNRSRMRMHSQQVRIAEEIARYFIGKPSNYFSRKQVQRNLLIQKKQKRAEREKALKAFAQRKKR